MRRRVVRSGNSGFVVRRDGDAVAHRSAAPVGADPDVDPDHRAGAGIQGGSDADDRERSSPLGRADGRAAPAVHRREEVDGLHPGGELVRHDHVMRDARARVGDRQRVPDGMALLDGSCRIRGGIDHEVGRRGEVKRRRGALDRSRGDGRVVVASDRRLVRGADRNGAPELTARAVVDRQTELDADTCARLEVAKAAPERGPHQAGRGRGDQTHSRRQPARNDHVVGDRGTAVPRDERPGERRSRGERTRWSGGRHGDVGRRDEGSGDGRRERDPHEQGADRRRRSPDPTGPRVSHQPHPPHLAARPSTARWPDGTAARPGCPPPCEAVARPRISAATHVRRRSTVMQRPRDRIDAWPEQAGSRSTPTDAGALGDIMSIIGVEWIARSRPPVRGRDAPRGPIWSPSRAPRRRSTVRSSTRRAHAPGR